MKPDDESVLIMMGDIPSDLDLMAYADGELDPAASERMRQYLLGDPTAAAKVRVLQQLRDASRRVGQAGPAVPQALLQKIEAISQPASVNSQPEYDDRGYPRSADGRGANNENPYSITQARQSPGRARWAFPQRFAAAAVLLIALGGFLFWFTYDSRIKVTQNSGIIPAAWVTSTARQHIDCSSHANHFGPGFPRTVSELPSSLHEYLGHDSIVPNLSKLGYQFAGAGPCTIPGGKTVHLLYRPTSGGNMTSYTVSLFVQPDTNQLPLEKGKVYYATDAIDKTPMIIWRGQGVIYYLVGEDKNQLSDAARQMGMNIRI
jgi:hypothetical protein